MQVELPKPILSGGDEQHLVDDGKPHRKIAVMNLDPSVRFTSKVVI
jgi:hypothetical protein